MSESQSIYEPFNIRFDERINDEVALRLSHMGGANNGRGSFKVSNISSSAPVTIDLCQNKQESKTTPANKTRGTVVPLATLEQQVIGQILFKGLFDTKSMQDCYVNKFDVKDTLRITLEFNLGEDIPPTAENNSRMSELLNFPWERLYDTIRTNHYLSTLPEKCSIVRSILTTKVAPSITVDKLHILIVPSSPVDHPPLLDLDSEIKRIKSYLDANKQVSYEVLTRGEGESTEEAIRRIIDEKGPFHVFHYLGHGLYDDTGGALVFEDQAGNAAPIHANTFSKLVLESQKNSINLIFLNACKTATTNESNAASLAGVAQDLIFNGASAVVAMQKSVSDDEAINFAGEFYRLLADYNDVDYAVAQARIKMCKEWWIPVLYLQSGNVQLFKKSPAPPAPPKKDQDESTQVAVVSDTATEGKKRTLYLDYLKEEEALIEPLKTFLKTAFHLETPPENRQEVFESDGQPVVQLDEPTKEKLQRCDVVLACWISRDQSWVMDLEDYWYEELGKEADPLFYIAGPENRTKKSYLRRDYCFDEKNFPDSYEEQVAFFNELVSPAN